MKNKTWSSSVVVAATAAEKQKKKRYPGESKGFVEEMRFVAMRLHTKEQAKEGEKETKAPEERPVAKWEPTVEEGRHANSISRPPAVNTDDGHSCFLSIAESQKPPTGGF